MHQASYAYYYSSMGAGVSSLPLVDGPYQAACADLMVERSDGSGKERHVPPIFARVYYPCDEEVNSVIVSHVNRGR